jgi:hypothetical protein
MFGKSKDDRWDAAIKYLNDNFIGLGNHINSLVPAGGKRDSISKQLSLGSRSDGKDDPQYAAVTKQRLALRSLLMCQRVYFSADTWCKSSPVSNNDGAVEPYTGCMTVSWKTDSLAYWGPKGEDAIKNGIKMFVNDPTATRNDLQAVAFAGRWFSSEPEHLYKLSRADQPVTDKKITTCYMGIQGWMLLSGLASLRWVMKNAIPTKQAGCGHIFGPGREVWRGLLNDQDVAPVRRMIRDIPKGSLVHIWSPQNYNWNGHWVITNGDDRNGDGGTVCGVNNATFEAATAERRTKIERDFTNISTLFEQFWCYGGDGERAGKNTAVMEVFDPLALGNGVRI